MSVSRRRLFAVLALIGAALVVYAFWGGATTQQDCAARGAVLVSGRCVDKDVVHELERNHR